MDTGNIKRKRKYYIKSKFRFITCIAIMMILAVCIFSAATGLIVSQAETVPQYTLVEINSGDTLWEIANEYKSDNTDTRKAVYEICKANDIKASDLVPGMTISIPDDI